MGMGETVEPEQRPEKQVSGSRCRRGMNRARLPVSSRWVSPTLVFPSTDFGFTYFTGLFTPGWKYTSPRATVAQSEVKLSQYSQGKIGNPLYWV